LFPPRRKKKKEEVHVPERPSKNEGKRVHRKRSSRKIGTAKKEGKSHRALGSAKEKKTPSFFFEKEGDHTIGSKPGLETKRRAGLPNREREGDDISLNEKGKRLSHLRKNNRGSPASQCLNAFVGGKKKGCCNGAKKDSRKKGA